MKQISTLALWFSVILILFKSSFAQDPIYSQPFNNKLYLNPAFAGFDPGINVSTGSRSQWVGSDPYQTQNINVSSELPAFMSGVGLVAQQNTEGAGKLMFRSYEMQYAFRNRPCVLKNYRTEFSLGLGVSYNQWRLNNSDGLIFSDQIDPFTGAVLGNSAIPADFLQIPFADYVDFSGGALVDFSWGASSSNSWTRNMYTRLGFSFRHPSIGSLNPSLGDLIPPRYTFHGTIIKQNASIREGLSIVGTFRADFQPTIVRSELSDSLLSIGGRRWFNSFQVGAKVLLANEPGAWIGAWWRGRSVVNRRNIHTLVMGAGFRIPFKADTKNERLLPPSLHVAFTYDKNLTGLLNDGGGTFEFSLSVRFPNGFGKRSNLSCSECEFSNRRYPTF